jgi:signal peptidase I
VFALARDIVRVATIAVLLAGFVRTFLVQAIRIPSRSMEPTLWIGDHILVNRFVYGPARFEWEREWLPLRRVREGDVVVFRSPREPTLDFVKRCVATQGQSVGIRAKTLSVDGIAVDETSYVHHTDLRTYPDSPFLEEAYRHRDYFGPLTVPARHFFALGDHRDISDDSRFWGPVPSRNLRGRLFLIYGTRGSTLSLGSRILHWVR